MRKGPCPRLDISAAQLLDSLGLQIPCSRSVRAEDLNPTHSAGPAQRLRDPQIDSKLPTLADPLSVAALHSVLHKTNAGFSIAQSQCGLPTTILVPGGPEDSQLHASKLSTKPDQDSIKKRVAAAIAPPRRWKASNGREAYMDSMMT